MANELAKMFSEEISKNKRFPKHLFVGVLCEPRYPSLSVRMRNAEECARKLKKGDELNE
jgi:hypothetical protein